MLNNRNIALIFSGYNLRAIIAFCRFSVENNIEFFLVAANENDPIFLTEYGRNVVYTRGSNSFSIEEFLRIKQECVGISDSKKIVIIPSTEFLNRFILSSRSILENNDFIVPLVDEGLYSLISDKYSFGELCKKYAIRVPEEYTVLNEEFIPFVAKPKHYFSDGKVINDKPFIVSNNSDYEAFKQRSDLRDFYYQEFVSGNSYYLLFYFDKNGTYTVYSQQNLIQQDDGLSIVLAKSSEFHLNSISFQFANLFKDLKYIGLVMIEVKQNKDQIYMIEANPRLWGPSQLILEAGMNLFFKFALDNKLIDNDIIFNKVYLPNIFYFWSGGIIKDQSEFKNLAFHNFDENGFFEKFSEIIKVDIFNKRDTYEIFNKEAQNK